MTTEMLTLQVAQARLLNPLVRELRLVASDGAALPGYSAGAHVQVHVALPAGGTDWRHYSLVNLVPHALACTAPREYVIAVRREDDGRGGSRFMHAQLQVGDRVTVRPPKNDFPLADTDDCAVLVAGGIGITPLASMAAQRRAEGRPVRLHYAGRSRGLMAYLDELGELLGPDLRLHADDEAGGALDVNALLDGCAGGDRLHVCGPRPLLDAVLAAARARGWSEDRVRFELFAAPPAQDGEGAFELVLAQSGRRLTVPAGRSILDCLIEHGEDPLYDCRRGECGVCSTPVLEGEVEHRDCFLSAAEKASHKVIQICVSRARGARLVLDL